MSQSIFSALIAEMQACEVIFQCGKRKITFLNGTLIEKCGSLENEI